MAIDKKIFVGGLDTDSDYRLVKNEDYVDALNIRNVLSSTNNTGGSIENIRGNIKINDNFPLLNIVRNKIIRLVFTGTVPNSGTGVLSITATVGTSSSSLDININYSVANPIEAALSSSNNTNITVNEKNIGISTNSGSNNTFVSGSTGLTFTGPTSDVDFSISATLTSSNPSGRIEVNVSTIQENLNQAEASTYKIIGSYEDSETNSVYYYACDTDGGKENPRHCILEYSPTSSSSTSGASDYQINIVYQDGRGENSFLNFNENFLITGISKVGDLLSWTDDLNRPRMIDVKKAKQNELNISNAASFTDNEYDSDKVKFTGISSHNFLVGDLIYVVQDSTLSIHDSYDGVAEVTAITSSTVTTNLIWQGDSSPVPGILLKANPSDAYSPIVSFGTLEEKMKYLDYHKHQPVYAPTYEYETNLDFNKNNLFGNLFQFKTRYKYTDGQFSAWSGISSIQIPLNYFGNSTNSSIDNFQDSNQIRISYLDTIGDVEKIELASRKGNKGEFFIIETKNNNFDNYLKLKKQSLTFSVPPVNFSTHVFKNDGLYPFIDKIESEKNQDETPKKAKALTLIDGNRNAFGNYVNGYDNVDINVNISPIYRKNPSLVTTSMSPTFNFFKGTNKNYNTTNSGTDDNDFSYIKLSIDSSHFNSIDWTSTTEKILNISCKWNKISNFSSYSFLTPKLKRKGRFSFSIKFPDSVNSSESARNYVVSYINGLTNIDDLYSTPHNASNNTPNNFSSALNFSATKKLYADLNGINIRIFARHNENEFNAVTLVALSAVNPSFIDKSQVVVQASFTEASDKLSQSYKAGAHHKHGLIYFDETGKAGNVNLSETSNFYAKFFTERDGTTAEGLPNGDFNSAVEDYGHVDAVASILHTPPIWATHYQWVYSGNSTVDEFVQLQIVSHSFGNSTDGARLFLNLGALKGQDYSYVEAKNALIDYNYVEGDRVRFIGKQGADFSFFGSTSSDANDYLDFKITSYEIFTGDDDQPVPNAEGIFISIDDPGITGFTEGSDANLTGLAVEIYRPKKNLSEEAIQYKEVGEKFKITNPGTEQRAHEQIFHLLNFGEVYLKPRTMYSDNGTNLNTRFVEDYYLNDFNDTNHYSVGRVRFFDENASERRYKASITYSQPYFSTLESNRISNFNPFNIPYRDFNEGYGSIQALKTREDGIIMFQENKISRILVSRQIIQSPDSSNIVTASTEVLSDSTEYSGDFGVSTNPESIVQHGYVFYFLDLKRSSALRLSRDGITNISDIKMRNYFNSQILNYSNFGIGSNTPNNRKIKLTLPAASNFTDSDLISLGYHIEGNPRKLYISIDRNNSFAQTYTPLLQNSTAIFVGVSIEDSDNANTICNRVSEKLNEVSKYHSSYVDSDSIIITYTQDLSKLNSSLQSTIANNEGFLNFNDSYNFVNSSITGASFTVLNSGFTDNSLSNISTFENLSNFKVVAGYDPKYDEYLLTFPSIENLDSGGFFVGITTTFGNLTSTFTSLSSASNNIEAKTLSFSGALNRWTSFYSFIPEFYCKINKQFVTFDKGSLYVHNSNNNRCVFYGVQKPCNIKAVFNADPSSVKTFNTLSLESYSENSGVYSYGDDKFEVSEFKTNLIQDAIRIPNELFNKKEGIRYANIPFTGITRRAEAIIGLGKCSYGSNTLTIKSGSIGTFKDMAIYNGLKVYKYVDGTVANDVEYGTISAISSSTITLSSTTSSAADIAVDSEVLFYADLNSIALSAGSQTFFVEGERYKGNYALVNLSLDSLDSDKHNQIYSISTSFSKSDLSNK